MSNITKKKEESVGESLRHSFLGPWGYRVSDKDIEKAVAFSSIIEDKLGFEIETRSKIGIYNASQCYSRYSRYLAKKLPENADAQGMTSNLGKLRVSESIMRESTKDELLDFLKGESAKGEAARISFTGATALGLYGIVKLYPYNVPELLKNPAIILNPATILAMPMLYTGLALLASAAIAYNALGLDGSSIAANEVRTLFRRREKSIAMEESTEGKI